MERNAREGIIALERKSFVLKSQIRKTANMDQVSTLQSAAQSKKGVNARGQAQPVASDSNAFLYYQQAAQFKSLRKFSRPDKFSSS